MTTLFVWGQWLGCVARLCSCSNAALWVCLQEKHPSPAYRLRGDINMLLLGDPGVAKSQVGGRTTSF
jgi:hypothetical protein